MDLDAIFNRNKSCAWQVTPPLKQFFAWAPPADFSMKRIDDPSFLSSRLDSARERYGSGPLKALLERPGHLDETKLFVGTIDEFITDLEILEYLLDRDYHETFLDTSRQLVAVVPQITAEEPIFSALWFACAIVDALLREFGGTAIDLGTLKVYEDELNLEEAAKDGKPKAARFVNVIASLGDDGSSYWLTTMPLGRFGAPELEVRDVPRGAEGAFVQILSAVSQIIIDKTGEIAGGSLRDRVEGFEMSIGSTVEISDSDIERAYSTPRNTALIPGKVVVGIKSNERASGAGQPMLEIVPPSDCESSKSEWLTEVAGRLFREEHRTATVTSDHESMLKAHEKAMDELPKVKQRYLNNQLPQSGFHVKAGFDAGHCSEFMWVRVKSWNGENLSGILCSKPTEAKALTLGQEVTLHQDDIYDWLITHPDGREEGNYTGLVLEEFDL